MNNFIFGKDTVPQRQRDRFVFPRVLLPSIIRQQSWRAESDTETAIDPWEIKDRRQERYKRYLDEAFGLDTRRQKSKREMEIPSWPCKPRKRSYLSSPDSIMDLPTYKYSVFPELLDWNCNNVLVAVMGRKYYQICWDLQSVVGHGITENNIVCSKSDPKGRLLLIGTDYPFAELHYMSRTKKAKTVICRCVNTKDYCSITTVDWSPTGKFFVIGCSQGMVSVFDRRTVHATSWQTTFAPIHTVQVSPDTRYIAVSYYNCPYAHVLVWPSLKFHCQFDAIDQDVQNLTWHPWCTALLAMSVVTPDELTSINLVDIPSLRLRKTFSLERCSLDAMLFSHRTGELVLSLWNSEMASFQLMVMSNSRTVVDQSNGHGRCVERVRTMMFSPDGSKLATVTDDADLIIWDFFPEERKATKKRNFSVLPAALDKADYGFVLR